MKYILTYYNTQNNLDIDSQQKQRPLINCSTKILTDTLCSIIKVSGLL